jgi:hypothetical protein
MKDKTQGPATPVKVAFAEEPELEPIPEEEREVEIPAASPLLPPNAKQEDAPPDLTKCTTEQLRYLLEQKLLAEAKEAEANKTVVTPPAKAPKNMTWVFNRAPTPFEWQFDGVVYEIGGHDMGCFTDRVAAHGKKRSILSLDPVSNTAAYKLALEGDPKFGHPLKVVSRTELIDRSIFNSTLGDGRPVPTHPELITVGGAEALMARRTDKFVELD